MYKINKIIFCVSQLFHFIKHLTKFLTLYVYFEENLDSTDNKLQDRQITSMCQSSYAKKLEMV